MTPRRDTQVRKRLRLLDVAASELARVGFDQANISTISERGLMRTRRAQEIETRASVRTFAALT
jgi:hypothetical protein